MWGNAQGGLPQDPQESRSCAGNTSLRAEADEERKLSDLWRQLSLTSYN